METNEELITLARRLPELFQEAQLGETRYLEEDDLAALDATGYAAVAVAQKLADALEAATAVPVWEYGLRRRRREPGLPWYAHTTGDTLDGVAALKTEHDELVRRQLAGDWQPLPVEGESNA